MTLHIAHHALMGITSTAQRTNASIVHQNLIKAASIAMLQTVYCVKVDFTWPTQLSMLHLKFVKVVIKLISSA